MDLVGNGFHTLAGGSDHQLRPFVARKTLFAKLLERSFIFQQRTQASVAAHSLFRETTLPQFLRGCTQKNRDDVVTLKNRLVLSLNVSTAAECQDHGSPGQ